MKNFLKNKFFIILFSLLILVSFIYFSANVILFPGYFQGFSYPEITNNFCQNLNLNNSTFIDRSVCKNSRKKFKFIWIFLDGVAYDQLDLLTRRKEMRIPNLFKITTEQYRQSGSLHETYLTGKFSRNFPAEEIKIDHIFKQAAQADFPMNYRGTNFPLYFLLGDKNSKIVKNSYVGQSEPFPFKNMCEMESPFISFNLHQEEFPDHIDNNGDIKINLTDFYELLSKNFTNESQINSKEVEKCLINAGLKNSKNIYENSLIFYTMIIDHMNHSFHKFNSLVLARLYALEKDLMVILDWIEANPDYALIISSDHGGQAYNGEDNICNHGCNNPGNEAIFSIITKDLIDRESNRNKTHVEFGGIEDIAPTVAQILNNVNIPLEAKGFPLFLNDDPFYNLLSLRSKEIQILNYIMSFLVKENNNHLQNIFDKIESSFYANKLKKIIYEDDINKISNISLQDFIKKYKDFLITQQDNINVIVRNLGKSNKTKIFLISVFIFLLFKFYYIFKVIFNKTRNSLSPSSREKVIKGLYVVIFILFIDIFVTFIKADDISYSFEYSHLSLFLIFMIGILIIKFLISKEEQILDNYKLTYEINILIIGTFSTFIIVLITFYFNLFLKLKMGFRIFEDGKKLDYLNYFLFILYMFNETRKFKEFYLDSKLRFRLDLILHFYYIIIFILMIIFDYSFPKHFVNQTYFSKMLVRAIYLLILFLLINSFKSFYIKVSYDKIRKSGMIFSLIKYPLILYINFISDEAERIYMYILILPLFHFYSKCFKKSENIILKLIIMTCLILLPDVIFTLNKGSFSFDVSLKVCTKSIGDYPDQTPIFTGFLMGTHKLGLFIIAAGFIIENFNLVNENDDIINNKNKILDRNSYCMRLLMQLQLTGIMIRYFYYLYKDYEEVYLNIFLWAGTKCITILLLDLILIFNYFLHLRKKQIFNNIMPITSSSHRVTQKDTDILFQDNN